MNCRVYAYETLACPTRVMREFPRHKATDSFVISEASAVPELTDVAAAHTFVKPLNQRSERSSQTHRAVTASGTCMCLAI